MLSNLVILNAFSIKTYKPIFRKIVFKNTFPKNLEKIFETRKVTQLIQKFVSLFNCFKSKS